MTTITSKTIKEKTARILDRVRAGESFRVMRNNAVEALLLPPGTETDASWADITAEVRSLRAATKAKDNQANPVLAERKRRNYATRLR